MCIYGIFKDSILGFIVSKLRKLPNLKNIQAIVNMPPPKDPQDPSIECDGIILQLSKTLLLLWHLSLT